MTRLCAGRLLATAAALAVAAAGTAGCTKTVVGGLAHHLEPGLGANVGVTNQTDQTVLVQERAQGPNEAHKPYNPVTDGQYTIPAGQTVYLTDVNLPVNGCAGYTLLAYACGKVIARKETPLCADAKGHAGWTITTPSPAPRRRRRLRAQSRRPLVGLGCTPQMDAAGTAWAYNRS